MSEAHPEVDDGTSLASDAVKKPDTVRQLTEFTYPVSSNNPEDIDGNFDAEDVPFTTMCPQTADMSPCKDFQNGTDISLYSPTDSNNSALLLPNGNSETDTTEESLESPDVDSYTTSDTESGSSFEFHDFQEPMDHQTRRPGLSMDWEPLADMPQRPTGMPELLEDNLNRHTNELRVQAFNESWRRTPFSPIAEEWESDEGRDVYDDQPIRSPSNASSSSSSDLVFQTSTLAGQKAVKNNVLMDLVDDPEFQQLVLQKDHGAMQFDNATVSKEVTRLVEDFPVMVGEMSLATVINISNSTQMFASAICQDSLMSALKVLKHLHSLADAMSWTILHESMMSHPVLGHKDSIMLSTTENIPVHQCHCTATCLEQHSRMDNSSKEDRPLKKLVPVEWASIPRSDSIIPEHFSPTRGGSSDVCPTSTRTPTMVDKASQTTSVRSKDMDQPHQPGQFQELSTQTYWNLCSSLESVQIGNTKTYPLTKTINYAYVTMAQTNEQAIGSLILAYSIQAADILDRRNHLVVFISDYVDNWLKQLLADVFDHVYLTTELCSHDDVALSLLGRPELGITFTKLHCWRLTQYHKCVFLDSDTLVLQQCDELFEREELSAVPDTGWPDCFNSGVFVFRPSLETYARLVNLATTKGSFDGGDQGLLNAYFGDWRTDMAKRLPFMYNVVASTSYTYLPAYKHYSSGVKIVHFLGSEKPWAVPWDTTSGNVQVYHNHPLDMNVPVLQMWLGLFREKVLHKLPNVAQEEVDQKSSTTVTELLNRIRDGAIRQAEAPPQWQQADPLVQEYFPTQVYHVPPPQPQPPTQMSHYEPPPPLDEHHHHDVHHWEPSPPQEECHAPPSECHDSTSRWDWHEPDGSVAGFHQQAIQEPVDPHWEALLWHTVQSPWEPPSPPSEDMYFAPPSVYSSEPQGPPPPPTFGWYSSRTGASTPPSEHHQAKGLPGSQQPSEHEVNGPSDASSSFRANEPHETLGPLEEEYDEGSLPPQPETEEESLARMRAWEEGNIDYLGKDSFSNIWKRLEMMFVGEDSEEETLDDVRHTASEVHESTSTASLPDSETLVPSIDGGLETYSSCSEDSLNADIVGYPEGDYSGMVEWQEGRIDYCGRDKSDNIMNRLDLIFSGKIILPD